MKIEEMTEAYFCKNYIKPFLKEVAQHFFKTTGVRERSGIPDYAVCINDKFIYIEAKKYKGKLTPSQKREFPDIVEAKVPLFIADPGNWETVVASIIKIAQLWHIANYNTIHSDMYEEPKERLLYSYHLRSEH